MNLDGFVRAGAKEAGRALAALAGNEDHSFSRRGLLGAGIVGGLLMAARPSFAFAGVGGGAWGNYGGTAYVGSHFGYDGGWAYSSNGKAWISLSVNATCTWGSDLYYGFSVSLYYANGGANGNNNTWWEDYPDTHVASYFERTDNQQLISDVNEGFYDTKADTTNYQGPYCTNVHTVHREYGPYSINAVGHVWCDSDDWAKGINRWEVAPQTLPGHYLVTDHSLEGKVWKINPQCAPNMCLDVAGGASDANGTNVNIWENIDTTSQCWTVNRNDPWTTIQPAIETKLCVVDSGAGRWDNGGNVHLWEWVSGDNQRLYLHHVGNGWYYPVFEHSGYALNVYGAGTANGTNVQQYNCWADGRSKTDNASLFRFVEAEFKLRAGKTMTLTGKLEENNNLTAGDPNSLCIPYNHPNGSKGIYWKYKFFKGATQGAKTTVLQDGTSRTLKLLRSMENSWITCEVTGYTPYRNYKYKGVVTSQSVFMPYPYITITIMNDGEVVWQNKEFRKYNPFTVPQDAINAAQDDGCILDGFYTDAACTKRFVNGTVVNADLTLYSQSWMEVNYFADKEKVYSERLHRGAALTVPQAAITAATRPNCNGLVGWWEDIAYTKKFVNGTKKYSAVNLYARNKVSVGYGTTTPSSVWDDEVEAFRDPECKVPITAPNDVYPATKDYWYNDRVDPTTLVGTKLWYKDMDEVRELPISKIYKDPDCTVEVNGSVIIKANTVFYVHWWWALYDGVLSGF